MMTIVPTPAATAQSHVTQNIPQSITLDASTPDFSLTANPTSLTIPVGATETVQVTATSLNGFTGTVYLSAFSYPAHVSLTPTSLTLTSGGSESSTLTVSVPSGAPPGDYPVLVEATDGCSLFHVAEVAVQVIGPDYTIVAAKNTLTVSQSVSDSTDLDLMSLNGFAGTVSIFAYSSDFTVDLSPGSVDLTSGGIGSTTMTVQANPSAQPGNYTLVVAASSGNSLFHSANITVIVPGDSFTLSANPEFVTLVAGGLSNTTTISVAPIENFFGDVTLTASPSFPAGVDGSLDKTVVSIPPAGTSLLTVSAAIDTPAGFYEITVTGYGGDITSNTDVFIIVKAPDFEVTPDTFFMELVPGSSSCQTTITATELNGFKGTIDLTEKHDPGLTVIINPGSVIIPDAPTSTLTVSADPGIAPGFYSIEVNGTSGSIVRDTFVGVLVIGPDFSLSANPTPATFNAGSTATSTITVIPTNSFTDAVDLSVATPPDLNASILPTTVTSDGYTATLSLNSTIPGVYFVDVAGSTSAGLFHDVVVPVTVRGPDFAIDPSTPTTTPCTVGADCDTTINIAALNGFSGTVTFDVLANPSLSCNQPSSVTGSGSIILTCGAASAGSYDVNVVGTSGSIIHATGVITYQVTVAPDFSLSAGPVSPSQIFAGSPGVSSITVAPAGGFSRPISFAVSTSTPSGLVCQTPPDWTGTQTPVLSCSATAAGDYSVIVTGTATIGGSAQHSTNSILFNVVDFSIGPNPTTVTATVGVAGTSTITISPQNQFIGAVGLSTDHSECSLVSNSVTAPGYSDLTCTFASSGAITVTITGTISGLSHSTTVTFTINPPPNFGLSTNPTSLTIQSGNSGSSTIAISPSYGFTGKVDLTASVSPSGPTTSLSTASITGGSGTSTLTINVGSDVAAGTYTITVQGTSGSLSHSATVTLTVTAVQGVSTALTILGLDQTVFYSIIGIVAVIIVAAVTLVMRGRPKTRR